MEAFLNLIISKITGLAKWFGDAFVSIFKAVWDMVKDAFAWLFSQVLDVAISAVNAIDVSALDGYTSAWSSMPEEVLKR